MERFASIWQLLTPILGQLWWDGVAAAVVLTVMGLILFELWRVRDKLQRKNAVPEWSLAMYGDPNSTSPKSASSGILRIDLINTGWGTARDIEVIFQSNNGNKPSALRLGYYFHTARMAAPGELVPVLLRWNFSEPLEGWMVVRSKNRIGERFSQRFTVVAFVNPQSVPVYEVTSD